MLSGKLCVFIASRWIPRASVDFRKFFGRVFYRTPIGPKNHFQLFYFFSCFFLCGHLLEIFAPILISFFQKILLTRKLHHFLYMHSIMQTNHHGGKNEGLILRLRKIIWLPPLKLVQITFIDMNMIWTNFNVRKYTSTNRIISIWLDVPPPLIGPWWLLFVTREK